MLEILHEDSSCLAVVKLAGVSTQAPPGIDCLEERVRDYLRQAAIAAGEPVDAIYLGLPHRLDRPVSGAIVFAKTRRAARIISRQFERRQVKKTYWACVEGQVDPPEGTWIDFLRKVPNEPRVNVVAAGEPQAQQAILHFRAIGKPSFDPAISPLTTHHSRTLLEITLETGRMHQIRVQAASRGHPVVGDIQYGATASFGPQAGDPRERAIALHARSLAFRHPESKQTVTVTAPAPAAWNAMGIS